MKKINLRRTPLLTAGFFAIATLASVVSATFTPAPETYAAAPMFRVHNNCG